MYLAAMSHIGYQQAHHYMANYQHSRGRHLLRVKGYYKDYSALLTTRGGYGKDGSGTADDGGFRVPTERPHGGALLIAAFISIGRDRSDEILNQLP